jgi:hypothetical protein
VGGEIVFNVADGQVTEMPTTTLKEIGFRERTDLQRWIEEYPEVVERDLLVITTEFNQWELRAHTRHQALHRRQGRIEQFLFQLDPTLPYAASR